MAYINHAFTQRIHVPNGIVERTLDLGIERDSRWSKLAGSLSLPEAHGGRIPAETRNVNIVPADVPFVEARAAVHQALSGVGFLERLVVDVPTSGPTSYTWRERGGSEQTSTTPPAGITRLADALAALHALVI